MNIDPRDKYITLKEASKISGYTPDYLGQLIRKGKLLGKQIYLNVAWVTTEEAVREHMKKNEVPGAEVGVGSRMAEKFKKWKVAHSSTDYLLKVAKRTIYVVLVGIILLIVLLLWAFWANATRT